MYSNKIYEIKVQERITIFFLLHPNVFPTLSYYRQNPVFEMFSWWECCRWGRHSCLVSWFPKWVAQPFGAGRRQLVKSCTVWQKLSFSSRIHRLLLDGPGVPNVAASAMPLRSTLICTFIFSPSWSKRMGITTPPEYWMGRTCIAARVCTRKSTKNLWKSRRKCGYVWASGACTLMHNNMALYE